MKIEFNKTEIELLLHLLDELSERYSYDGCNEIFAQKEKDFVKELNIKNSDTGELTEWSFDLINYMENKIENAN